MSVEQFEALPNEITVRELRYDVHQNGFRVKKVTLVTTLLDDEVYSLPELAELYRRRWEQETNFGHIKTTMKMDVLKCKTGVHQYWANAPRTLHVRLSSANSQNLMSRFAQLDAMSF